MKLVVWSTAMHCYLIGTSATLLAICLQCLKLMVAQSPLSAKNWVGPVNFDPGQVKIIIGYIRREIFWTFLGDQEKIVVWNTVSVRQFWIQMLWLSRLSKILQCNVLPNIVTDTSNLLIHITYCVEVSRLDIWYILGWSAKVKNYHLRILPIW